MHVRTRLARRRHRFLCGCSARILTTRSLQEDTKSRASFSPNLGNKSLQPPQASRGTRTLPCASRGQVFLSLRFARSEDFRHFNWIGRVADSAVEALSPSIRKQGSAVSRVAQWKRAGPITQRSVDRNYVLLALFFSPFFGFSSARLRQHSTTSHFYSWFSLPSAIQTALTMIQLQLQFANKSHA